MAKQIKVLHYAASRASQNMCKQPRLSKAEQIVYSAQSESARECLELLEHSEKLTEGQILYLNMNMPNWRQRIPETVLV